MVQTGTIAEQGMQQAITDLPKQEAAYRLHVRGKSLRAIAKLLGISKTTAQKYVHELQVEHAASLAKDREVLVAQRIARWEEVIDVAWEQHRENGDPYLLSLISTNEEKIAKIQGLYRQDVESDSDSDSTTIIIKAKSAQRIHVE